MLRSLCACPGLDYGVFMLSYILAIVTGHQLCTEIDPTRVREWFPEELHLDGVRSRRAIIITLPPCLTTRGCRGLSSALVNSTGRLREHTRGGWRRRRRRRGRNHRSSMSCS